MSSLNRSGVVCVVILSSLVWAATSSGASLKAETVNAWDEYVSTASLRLQHHLDDSNAFLWTDETPDRAARVLRQEIVVAASGPYIPIRVPSGLVHDWIGAAFIPNAAIRDVLLIVRDYARYSEFYSPNVVDSKTVAISEVIDRFSMVLRNKTPFSRIAFENEYQANYVHMDDQRVYSVSRSTRIREIAEYGTSGQHILPQDEVSGLLWRIYSVTRLDERDGGVYIEMEVIVLSRDIPAAVRWFVGPLVRRASREYLMTVLRQTREAVQSASAAVRAREGRSNKTNSGT
jgi:hypothetical protein